MAQYDIISGLDLSSLASASLSQITQAINQAAPLSNVALTLCFDGNAAGAAGVGFPDVASNPRYVRYLWLDTQSRNSPILKRYVGTYSGTPANPSAMSNKYTDWQGVIASGVVGNLIGVTYYPYQSDATKLLNNATKYIDYVQTGSFTLVMQIKITCVVADLDYNIGDEINIESVQGIYPGVVCPGFTVHRFNVGSDFTLRVAWPNSAVLDLLVLRKDTTAVAAIDQSKWALIFYLYS